MPGFYLPFQVYATSATSDGPSIAANFPMIKIINWFDIKKPEGEAEVRQFLASSVEFMCGSWLQVCTPEFMQQFELSDLFLGSCC